MYQPLLFEIEQLAPVPETGWTPPESFPRLDAAKRIAVDLETCDPDLKEKGIGVRRDGRTVGIAVGTDDARWYFPFGHERGANLDREQVLRWARDELGRYRGEVVGANLAYDLDYLATDCGVHMSSKCTYHDVQNAEPLLDEHRRTYNLEALGSDYLGEGKTSAVLYRWLADAFGGKPTAREQGTRIWRAPPSLVGPYAEGDVTLPLKILDLQHPKLEAEGLWDLFELESDLVPLLVAMRRQGVRVNVGEADRLREELLEGYRAALARLRGIAGRPVDVWSAGSLAPMFDAPGVTYARTAKTAKPSITQKWLEGLDNEEARLVLEARRLDKLRGTFLDSQILGSVINGRIHPTFNQLRTDDGGTVSGRFSGTDPNLQFIPTRTAEGAKIRRLFVPEEGERWVRYDYAQIEPRILLHYASGEAAERVREKYRADPRTDCYRAMMENMEGDLGQDRQAVKSIYLGLSYEMKPPKYAMVTGKPLEEAEADFAAFHRGAPYIQRLSDRAKTLARRRGYIVTILGRRSRFPFWESVDWDVKKAEGHVRDRNVAVARWGRVVRSGTHTAGNHLIQGSAADQIKKAMRDIWKSGVCAVIGVPRLTVHDELGFSAPRTPEADEALVETRHIMETCVPMRVPVVVDMSEGSSWGACK